MCVNNTYNLYHYIVHNLVAMTPPFHPAIIHILNSELHVEEDKLELNVNDQLPILCLLKCISPIKVNSNR